VDPRTKSSLLWGIIGGMSFGVLAQAYMIIAEPLPIGIWGVLFGGVTVGTITTVVTYATEYRLMQKGRT